MGATALHGYPYPEGSDQPQVHLDVKALADDVDEDTYVVCTAATRPAGVSGRRIFETDTGATLFYYDPPGGAAAGWYPPWNLPWGEVGLATATADVAATALTTIAQLTGLTLTEGRKYRAVVHSAGESTVAGDVMGFAIRYDGTTEVGYAQIDLRTAGVQEGVTVGPVAVPATATSVQLVAFRVTGTGSTATKSAATKPTTVQLVDDGPA